jgi:transposase
MSSQRQKSKGRCRGRIQGGSEEPPRGGRHDVAGVDVHAIETYIACSPAPDGEPNVRRFPTDTASLQEAADWLASEGVRSAAMESTGVYWMGLYQVLNARGIEVQLVDARMVRTLPGRKTDVLDCQWLRQLHSCGLLSGCFLPDDSTAALRSLQRMRQSLRRSQEDWIRRIQKHLDMMNVRIHRAVSDITGVTGMAMLRAIVAGERDPANLAALRDRRCHKSIELIVRELTGNWREEHLQNLELSLETYDHFTRQIERVDRHIADKLEMLRLVRESAGLAVLSQAPDHPSPEKAKRLIRRGEEPMRQALARTFGIDLTRIEAVAVETAASVFMEMGPDIPDRFSTEERFLSYLRLAPRLAISGGRRHPPKGRRIAAGGLPLRRHLLTAASTVRNSSTPLGDYYRKLAYRKGAAVAAFATAGKIAKRIYRALKHGIDHAIEGERRYQETEKARRIARLSRHAATLGMNLVPCESPASS